MGWKEAQTKDVYVNAPYEQRVNMAHEYFSKVIASDERFPKGETPEEKVTRENIYKGFMSSVKEPSNLTQSFKQGWNRGGLGLATQGITGAANWGAEPPKDSWNTIASGLGEVISDAPNYVVGGAIGGAAGLAAGGLPAVITAPAGAMAYNALQKGIRKAGETNQNVLAKYEYETDPKTGKQKIKNYDAGAMSETWGGVKSGAFTGAMLGVGGQVASPLLSPWISKGGAITVGELAGMQTAGVLETGNFWNKEEIAINIGLLLIMKGAKSSSDFINKVERNNLDKLAQVQIANAIGNANVSGGTADLAPKNARGVNPDVTASMVAAFNKAGQGGEKAKLAAIADAQQQIIATLFTQSEFQEYAAKFPKKVPVETIALKWAKGEPAPKGKEAPKLDLTTQTPEVIESLLKNPKNKELYALATAEKQRRIDAEGKGAVEQTAETLTETKAEARNILPPVTEVVTKPNRAAEKFKKLIEDTGTPESAVSTRINSNLKKIGLTGTQVDAGTGMLDINITNKEGKPAGILTLAVTDKGIEILSIDNQNVKGNHIADNVFKTLSDISKETGLPVTGTFTNPISEAAYKKHFPKAEQKGMSYAELETLKAKLEATNGLQKEGKEKTQVEPILAKPTFKEYVESKGVEMPKAGTPEHKALLAEFNAEPVVVKVAPKEYNPEVFKPNHMVETINLEANFKHTKRVIPAKEAVLELKQNRDILTALKAFRECIGA